MRNKGFWLAFTCYIVMFCADIWSTLINWDMVQYLEANPLYRFGGLPLIFLINILVGFLYFYFYTKSENPMLRFVLMWGLVMTIITRIIVVYSNYQIFLHPPSLEVAKALTYETKTKALSVLLLAINLLPMLQTLFTYYFWNKDHIIYIKRSYQH